MEMSINNNQDGTEVKSRESSCLCLVWEGSLQHRGSSAGADRHAAVALRLLARHVEGIGEIWMSMHGSRTSWQCSRV
jgi:hypothetical protein